MSSAREEILEKVRAALEVPSHVPSGPEGAGSRIAAGLLAATPPDRRGLAEQFKKEVEAVSGECHLFEDESPAAKLIELLAGAGASSLAVDGRPESQKIGAALAASLPELRIIDAMAIESAGERRTQLAAAAAGLVSVDYGIADTGSLVLCYEAASSGLAHVLPETIFALLPAERLLPHLGALVDQADAEKRKHMVLITGPSRTADIEKILILGAHGPKRLVVLIY